MDDLILKIKFNHLIVKRYIMSKYYPVIHYRCQVGHFYVCITFELNIIYHSIRKTILSSDDLLGYISKYIS